ncbi:hypothetical protein [Zavarzinia sp.]|uniref:hypothetical protein n=1 Tax=Zavarzinia sp. TaxID=2027920 RepID=UPI003BB4DB12
MPNLDRASEDTDTGDQFDHLFIIIPFLKWAESGNVVYFPLLPTVIGKNDLMLILILVLLLVFGGGGYYGFRRQYYGGRGFSLIGILLLILIVIALFGAPRMGYGW